MTKDEALKLALEALKEDRAWLETDAPTEVWEKNNEAITAIKAALLSRSDGEAKDEPVQNQLMALIDENQRLRAELKFNTTPPQRKPLTDEEIVLIVAECAASHQHTDIHFARAIEAKLRSKND